ncbi:MAG: hypothetical protein AAF511_01280 [Pseudomonadota bacterium]
MMKLRQLFVGAAIIALTACTTYELYEDKNYPEADLRAEIDNVYGGSAPDYLNATLDKSYFINTPGGSFVYQGRLDLLKVLFEKGLSPDSEIAARMMQQAYASQQDRTDIVRYLRQQGVSVKAAQDYCAGKDECLTPLFSAVFRNRGELVELAIEDGATGFGRFNKRYPMLGIEEAIEASYRWTGNKEDAREGFVRAGYGELVADVRAGRRGGGGGNAMTGALGLIAGQALGGTTGAIAGALAGEALSSNDGGSSSSPAVSYTYNETYRPVCPNGQAANQSVLIQTNSQACYGAKREYARITFCYVPADMDALKAAYETACGVAP